MKSQLLVLALVLGGALSASAFGYDEAVDGDILSFDEAAPTPLGAVDEGVNTIEGTATAEVDWGDVFSLTVPPGLEITSVVVEVSAHTGGFDAFLRVFETPVFQSLGFQLFDSGGTHSFSAVPLSAPGPYGFTAQFSGTGVEMGDSYTWSWTIVAPEPSGAAAPLAAGATLAAVASARARTRRRGWGRCRGWGRWLPELPFLR